MAREDTARTLVQRTGRKFSAAACPTRRAFPILAKLLDAREKLSLQVHPPAAVAASLGGESKNEIWYFAAADDGAEIFAGLRPGVTPGAV